MSRYRRPRIDGGTFFFTVVLADRSSNLLVIRDETDFECHVDYIHFNPVKHSHVTGRYPGSIRGVIVPSGRLRAQNRPDAVPGSFRLPAADDAMGQNRP